MCWLGQVLLRGEICKWIKTLLLAGTSCMGTQNAVLFVMMKRSQTLQQSVTGMVETKAWETSHPHLHCAVKRAALTGCPAPLPPHHNTYPQHHAWPQSSLKQCCGPAQLFVSTQVALQSPISRCLLKMAISALFWRKAARQTVTVKCAMSVLCMLC